MGGRLAGSMGRLGTESAFSVLARAKELEATGRRVIHLEIGEPDFDTPGHISRRHSRHARRPHALLPVGRDARAARGGAAHLSDRRGLDVDPGGW